MSTESFYVGYLPLPTADRRVLRVLIPTLFIVLAAVAAVVAWSQRDPGPAVWDTGQARAWTGLVRTDPYPVLETDEGIYLVVEAGKHTSRPRLEHLDGRAASLTGFLLERTGRRMIELEPGADAVTAAATTPRAPRPRTAGPEVVLTGEILDSKCYLGAMKPGDGKGHKACATLCIDGGIAPMLITTQPDGTAAYYILATTTDGPAGELVRPFIGEPVRVRGVPVRSPGLNLLRIGPGAVERLGP